MGQIPWLANLKPGRGLSSDSGIPFGYAVDFDAPTSVGTGQQVIASLESITSSSSLLDKLNISAKASFIAGAGGGSAEFNLARSVSINDYYTYALVRVIVTNPALLINNARFKDEAKNLLVNQGWDAFADSYGWEYVEGYITGGSFYGLIEIQTKSSSEQVDVEGKLSGYYGTFSGGISGSQQISTALSTYIKNVYTFQSAGSGDSTETTIEGMLQRAEAFPGIALANPDVILALTADYRNTLPLPNMPADNSLARDQQKQTLQDLGSAYLFYRDYKANLEFILSNFYSFDDFKNLSADQIAEKQAQYEASLQAVGAELDTIVSKATTCGSNYSMCQTYVRSVVPLPIPTIGGFAMTIKEMQGSIDSLTAAVNSAMTQANAATTQANAATTQANAAMTQANAATTQANAAMTQANAAMTQANAAYNHANR